MPLEINLPPESDSISLQEYIDAIDGARYDFSNRADLIDSARYLKRLSNNRHFLLDQMFTELKKIASFQQTNYYGPQVFMLHVAENYFVRANLWKPLSQVEKLIPNFQYDVCHDHNFDILTVGYFGPGYRSRTYSYDRQSVTGVLGEEVALIPQGVFTLSEGEVALYRAKHDVHIQLPPDDFSVSLNLIPKNKWLREQQFQFDEESGRICRYLQSSGSELVVRLAGVLGDKDALEPLAIISRENPSAHLRALAIVSQLQISNNGDISNDCTPLIRDIIEREVRSYGTCLRMVGAELTDL